MESQHPKNSGFWLTCETKANCTKIVNQSIKIKNFINVSFRSSLQETSPRTKLKLNESLYILWCNMEYINYLLNMHCKLGFITARGGGGGLQKEGSEKERDRIISK